MGEEKITRPIAPVDIVVHSIRRRLVDTDGISAKAVIDGLVKAGIFEDDNAQIIKSIKYTQESAKDAGQSPKTLIFIKQAQ